MDAETIAYVVMPGISYAVLAGVGIFLHVHKPNKTDDRKLSETSRKNLEYYLTSKERNIK